MKTLSTSPSKKSSRPAPKLPRLGLRAEELSYVAGMSVDDALAEIDHSITGEPVAAGEREGR